MYQLHIIRCGTIIASVLERVKYCLEMKTCLETSDDGWLPSTTLLDTSLKHVLFRWVSSARHSSDRRHVLSVVDVQLCSTYSSYFLHTVLLLPRCLTPRRLDCPTRCGCWLGHVTTHPVQISLSIHSISSRTSPSITGRLAVFSIITAWLH